MLKKHDRQLEKLPVMLLIRLPLLSPLRDGYRLFSARFIPGEPQQIRQKYRTTYDMMFLASEYPKVSENE
jgi:hypothetical protein